LTAKRQNKTEMVQSQACEIQAGLLYQNVVRTFWNH